MTFLIVGKAEAGGSITVYDEPTVATPSGIETGEIIKYTPDDGPVEYHQIMADGIPILYVTEKFKAAVDARVNELWQDVQHTQESFLADHRGM